MSASALSKEEHLRQWRELAMSGFSERPSRTSREERRRVEKLEKELKRRDKALAETAALLVLQGKMQALWAEEDDATRYASRTGRVKETWCSPTPEEARLLLAGADVPWWFAGGWALDLFLGAQSRAHADLDIGCFRADLSSLLEQLSGWDIAVAARGRLTPLSAGAELDPNAHGLWCRPAGSLCWVLEILVEDHEGSDWVFRRDRSIRRPATSIVSRTPTGLAYMSPEIQLLYKAKDHRLRDDLDFRTTWPSLGGDARSWLLEHLKRINPTHPWLVASEAGEHTKT